MAGGDGVVGVGRGLRSPDYVLPPGSDAGAGGDGEDLGGGVGEACVAGYGLAVYVLDGLGMGRDGVSNLVRRFGDRQVCCLGGCGWLAIAVPDRGEKNVVGGCTNIV